MPFVRVRPSDTDLVATAVDIVNTADKIDDPDSILSIPELTARSLEFGWDLEPGEKHLYYPEGSQTPVGVLDVDLPMRDNRHLVWCGVLVHPDHRRQGHGSAMVAEVLRRTKEAGRDTIWIGAAEDDLGAKAFAEQHGFAYASHDARRRQVLAEVDTAAIDALYAASEPAGADYELVRQPFPAPVEVLEQLVKVTEAINDAPMGELKFEDEKFDVQRLSDLQTAATGRGDLIYRIYARHRETGEIGGHTMMVVNPLRPTFGGQGDTAVSREHRGHRLGLLLKIAMMRWMAEEQPQLEMIETWNHADNTYMISVNESIGYRLSRVFAEYQLLLPSHPPIG